MTFPTDLVVDKKGNLLIVDQSNWNIRKVTPEGTITTLAISNSTTTGAGLFYPTGIALDADGNIFIADRARQRVCKLDTNGVLTTVAGNSVIGFSGDGGPAVAAKLNYPNNVAVDSLGNLYISDEENYRIRKVDTNGIITTVAGTGVSALSGDGGPAIAATLNHTRGLTIDKNGNLYIADSGNNRIRKIDPNGIITTVAGSTQLYQPNDVTIDIAGNLFIAENQNNCIRVVDTYGIMTTVVGNGLYSFSGDGGYSERASLRTPVGVTFDSRGNLFIADFWNYRVRKVTGLIISKQTGSWLNNSLWNCQCTPTIESSVTILPGHNVTVSEPVQARTIKQYGYLTLTPNSKITFPSRGF
ncbi:hypothetical protein GCM10027592_08260 [Spirosoma flavus]